MDITLPKLRQILRAHYQEKSGTELYQELTTMVQGPAENPQDFLLRALSLRERVIFASKTEGAVMKYEPGLVQSLFIHAVETGLRDEAIRNKLRPVLQKSGSTDEELMESLNKIVSVEGERKAKLGHRTTKVSNVDATTSGSVDEQHPKGKTSKSNQTFNLKSTLEVVQASSRIPSLAGRKQRRLCKSCEEAKVERCDHCFKCGSSEHFARGCTKPSSPVSRKRDMSPIVVASARKKVRRIGARGVNWFVIVQKNVRSYTAIVTSLFAQLSTI